MTKIKVIMFDFMGVLLVKRKNYQPNKLVDLIDAEISQVTDDREFSRKCKDRHHLSQQQFNSALKKIVGKYEIEKSLWSLLPQLREHYKLGVVNNGTALTLPGFEKKFRIKRNFDLFLSSALENIIKPNLKMYHLAAKKLKVNCKECLFIDDTKENVVGAKKAGMQTIYWDRKKSIEEKLDELKRLL